MPSPIRRPLLAAVDALPLPSHAAREACADPRLPIDIRLDALEDVMEAEVGDTPLVRARGIERLFGMRQVYLKFEGDNPTGTQKDRIAFAQVYDALRNGADGVCFATCGNYGVAMAYAAQWPKMRCLAVVPEAYDAPRIRQIEQLGAEVVRAGHDYEGAVMVARDLATRQSLYDANPGGENEDIQLRAYRQIADEIYDQLRDAPRVVSVPVSNGTTLLGVHKGFVSLERRGRTSRVPAMVAGSAFHQNPIVSSFQQGRERCEDLLPQRIRESRVNEPLINWHAIDGQGALEAVRNTGGAAEDVTDATMRHLAKVIREQQGMMVMPASTAGLAALLAVHRQEPLESDRYVAVLTGRSP